VNTLKKDAAETATKAATGQSAALAFKTQAVLIGQDACSQHKHRSTLVVLLSWCLGVLVSWCLGVLVFWPARVGNEDPFRANPTDVHLPSVRAVTQHAPFGDAL
jgi:hypothetical protein